MMISTGNWAPREDSHDFDETWA